MTTQLLTGQQIQDLMKERKPTVQSQKLVETKTKLVAVNEMRKQAGLDTVDKLDDMTLQDKRGWLILQDLWRKQITLEHANELLEGVYAKNERDQTLDSERNNDTTGS